MILNPRTGQRIQIWYRQSNSHLPYHGKHGYVLMSAKGKPRNHLIAVKGQPVVVPCGNIRKDAPA